MQVIALNGLKVFAIFGTPIVSIFAATIGTPVQVLLLCKNVNVLFRSTSALDVNLERFGRINTSE
jgi:hypothetical protein